MKKIFIKGGKWYAYERPEFGQLTHDDNTHQDIVEEHRLKALEVSNPEIISLPCADPNWDYDWPGKFERVSCQAKEFFELIPKK